MRRPYVNSGNKKDAESESEEMTSQVNTGHHAHSIFIDKWGTIPKKKMAIHSIARKSRVSQLQDEKYCYMGRGKYLLESVMDMRWYFVHDQCVLCVSDLIPLIKHHLQQHSVV